MRLLPACLAWAAALAPGLRAQDECVLPHRDRPVFLGDTLRLALDCPGALPGPVTWDFGDGSPASGPAASPSASHVYATPGLYTVFARIQGVDIPATTTVTALYRPTSVSPTRSSTLLFDSARGRIWAVNPDHHSVSAVDPAARALLFEVPAGRNPRTLALGPDGTVWVAAQDEGALVVLDGGTGATVATLRLPFASRPYGVAFDPEGRHGYATLEATGRLVRFDPASRRVTGTLELGPTPRGIAVSHDGSRVLVTRHLTRHTRPGASDYAEVWEVDGRAFALKRTFRLETDTTADRKDHGRGVLTGLSSITLSPDGREALIPCTKANTLKGLHLDGTRPTFETSIRTVVARLDLVENREDMATRKDIDNRSLASSVTFDRLGRHAYLTLHGDNRTAILLGHSLQEYSTLPLPENAPADLLAGRGRELAPDGSVLDARDSLLFVHYPLSREVGIYDITKAGTGDTLPRLALVRTVARETLPLPVLVGKQIFHNAADTRMGKEGYLSCAACHFDGATDGRVWDFTDRGEGLRRTTTLLGRGGMAHGPLHWSANFDEIQDFEHDIRGPFAGTGFLADADFAFGTRGTPLGDRKAGLSPELDALAAYVASLATVPPSPYRKADGGLTPEALRGKAVFRREDVGCAKCHAAPHYTDSRLPEPGAEIVPGPVAVFAGARSTVTREGYLLHDVGTLKASSGKRLGDSLPGLDTPTLKGLWATPPYLHDGSAATVRDVLESPGDRHGKTSLLSASEKDDLVAFLLQLDDLDDAGNTALGRPPASASPRPRLLAQPGAGGVHLRLESTRAGGASEARLFDLRGRLVRTFSGAPGRKAWTWTLAGMGPGVFLIEARVAGIGSARPLRIVLTAP